MKRRYLVRRYLSALLGTAVYLRALVVATAVMIFCFSTNSMGKQFSLELNQGWPFAIDDNYFWVIDPSPAMGNLNADPLLEAVFGTGDYGYYPLAERRTGRYIAVDASGNLLWEGVTNDDEAQAPPVIVDLHGDGQNEVLGGSCSGDYLLAYDGATGAELWHWGDRVCDPETGSCRRYGEYKGAAAVADVRADYPGLETIGADQAGTIVCLSAAGELIWEHYRLGDDITAGVAISDVDDDGQLEAVVVDEDAVVYRFDAGTGDLEKTYNLPQSVSPNNRFTIGTDSYRADIISSPALANLDADAALEIVVGHVNGSLYCLDGDTFSEQWNYQTGGPVASSPAVGDLDNDGVLDIVFGSGDNSVYALNADGTYKWTFVTGGPVNSSPALLNFKKIQPFGVEWPMFHHNPQRTGFYGQTVKPLQVIVGSDDGTLYFLKGTNGKLLSSYLIGSPLHSSPAVGDMDGDGFLDVIIKSEGIDLYSLELLY
jgi:outer membrane protein assembly factor BamB